VKVPWTAIKSDPAEAALTLRTAMNLIRLFGQISEPIVPDAAAALQGIFAERTETGSWPTREAALDLASLAAGVEFVTPPVLFRKISDEDVLTWRERFGAPAVTA
jgi:methionyl-tRNA synthetase